MTASFKLEENILMPETGSTSSFSINDPDTFYDLSTKIRLKENLLTTNKLEIQKIKNFKSLSADWDSYDAEPIDVKSIERAVSIIHKIDELDQEIYFSSPGPNGEVMLQLMENDKEIELIFYPDKSKYVTFEKGEFKNQGHYSEKILPELIEWLNM